MRTRAAGHSQWIRDDPRRERHGAERHGWRPLGHELQVHAVIGQLHEIELPKPLLEFTDEVRSILRADPEGNDRSGVAQHRMANVGLKLVEILVGQREPDAVLAQLGEHVRQGEGGKALEFVDVDEKVPTVIGRGVRAAIRPDKMSGHATSKRSLNRHLTVPVFSCLNWWGYGGIWNLLPPFGFLRVGQGTALLEGAIV
jgi:hypothetical protein